MFIYVQCSSEDIVLRSFIVFLEKVGLDIIALLMRDEP